MLEYALANKDLTHDDEVYLDETYKKGEGPQQHYLRQAGEMIYCLH